MRSLLGDSSFDDAAKLIEFLETKYGGDSELGQMAIGARLDLVLQQSKWEDVADTIRDLAKTLTDANLATAVDKVSGGATRAGRFDVIAAVDEFVLNETKDKPHARETAARSWVFAANDSKDVELTLKRTTAVAGMGFPATVLSRLITTIHPLVLASGTKEQVNAFIGLAQGSLTGLTDENERSGVINVLLDASFLADRPELTIELLEAGIPGQDQNWHETMINKVKAHKALKEGNKREAVDRFRKFMEYVKIQKEEEIVDSVSGERVTREMILGLNAARIGDILTDMKESAEARAAYGDAKKFYEDALKKLDKNSKEHARVTEQIAELNKKIDQGP